MVRHKLRGSDFLSLKPLDGGEIEDLVEESMRLKNEGTKGFRPLSQRALGLLFEKPSTRTRVSFEVAILRLGGHPMMLGTGELQLTRGETIEDTGKVLSRFLDGLIVRTSGQDRLEAIARASAVPVVNALTDESHPCQALADMLTILEYKGGFKGVKLAFLGDGNNVAHSLMRAGAKLGMEMVIATPVGREPKAEIVEECVEYTSIYGGSLKLTNDARDAASGSDVLYTDVWASMGSDADEGELIKVFKGFGVDEELLALAHEDAVVMHCLPAHRGMEITGEVLDGPRSAVWDQAENRLHAQTALLGMIYS